MRTRDRRVAAGVTLFVAASASSVLAFGGSEPDDRAAPLDANAVRTPSPVDSDTRRVLLSREGERGWSLVAIVKAGRPRLTLSAVDGKEWGVDRYGDPVSLREAEAWVVPGDAGDGDPFQTLIVGPMPGDHAVDAVAVEEQESEVRVLAEVVPVGGDDFYVARFDRAVRHLEVIGFSDRAEVFREPRQATYTDIGAGPIEGDAWVLDLVGERQWRRIDVLVTGQPDGEPVRTTVWGPYDFVERRVSDGHVYDAFVDQVRVTPHARGHVITDRRFDSCPPEAGSGNATAAGDVRPEAGFGASARYHIGPWREIEWLREHVDHVEVVEETIVGGRPTLRVRFTFRDNTPPRLATKRRYPDGLVWLIDRQTGVLVGEEGPFTSPTEVKILGVDDAVEPLAPSDVRLPGGSISYRLPPEETPGDRVRQPSGAGQRSPAVEGGSSLADVLDQLAPADREPNDCPRRSARASRP